MRSLIAVADAGSITEAAERLHVSQSALSRRLQQLEADLGGQLLVRGRQGIEVTDLGRQALSDGRGIVARYDLVRRNIAEQQNLQRGIVRIGGGATFTSFMLPEAIADFQSRHPGIRFHVKEGGSSEIAASVAGDLELGVLTLPLPTGISRRRSSALTRSSWWQGRSSPGHPSEVEAGDLAGLPFVAFEAGTAIRQCIDTALRDGGGSYRRGHGAALDPDDAPHGLGDRPSGICQPGQRPDRARPRDRRGQGVVDRPESRTGRSQGRPAFGPGRSIPPGTADERALRPRRRGLNRQPGPTSRARIEAVDEGFPFRYSG